MASVSDDPSSMAGILIASLSEILKASSRKHKQLRDAAQFVIDELKSLTPPAPPPTPPTGHHGAPRGAAGFTDADRYFLPLKLACDSKVAVVMEHALDCIQKLVAYGYLRGNSPIDRTQYPLDSSKTETAGGGDSTATAASPPPLSSSAAVSMSSSVSVARPAGRKLIDMIVETIYECSTFQDDGVQLQVIKALLTAVTGTTCEVHEHSLMLAVRACYHIHLSSRNQINRTTAKATLTQMLNIIFQNMETSSADLERIEERARKELERPQSSPAHRTGARPKFGAMQISENVEVSASESNTVGNVDSVAVDVVDSILVNLIHSAVSQAKAPRGKFGWCTACGSSAQHYCLQTKVPICSVECKRIHLDALSQQKPLLNAQLGATASGSSDALLFVQGRATVLQNDAFLLFRALCKLSIKQLSESENDDYPIALRSKTLSLELLLSILENCGPAFRTVRKFIDAVKDTLIMSLLENCVSPLEQIFSLSLSIFVTLIRQFKPHLKTEIGVFLDNIFLRIAENPNSTFGHKMMILQVFSKLAQDPQTIVDIFLNYDCDEKAVPIFQHLVSLLEKITQGRFVSENWISPQQEATLKMLGLESMVSVIKSLVAWSEKALAADELSKQSSEDAELAASNSLSSISTPFTTGKPSTASVVSPQGGSDDQQPALLSEVVAPSRQNLHDNFERLRLKRNVIEKAVLKFNLKPKSGIKFLIENGVITDDPESIAEFLHSNVGLDKTELGDYIGEGDAANIKILHGYVDYMDFTGLTFENALRYFLEGFRLPGEAQKIDRIMEKFAEKFCRCNPNVFASADVAYVLAYAVIMLNTDAHSSQVKNKMTKEQFLKNNRGINGDKDLDPEYLGGIYDRIKTNEIKMNDARSEQGQAVIDPKLRHVSFRRESLALVKKTQQLMQQGASQSSGIPAAEGFFYASPDDASAVKPMFQVLWGPAHGTFSVLLQDMEDPRLVALCLDGYRFAIRLAGLFQLHTEQEAFVQSLAQFTLLGTAKEMKQKNIDAIKILLTIAYTEGNRLSTCWGTVLKCISEFERLHLIGSGARSDSSFFAEASQHRLARDANSDASRSEQQAGNAQNVVGQIEPSLLDRIFTHSSRLSSEAIVYFVDNICQVSAREMAHSSEPRVFSLQKIVEITYYNMGRVRYVWSRMWRVLSEHFAHAGSHENARISMYAIDSLRQLAAKFLEKEELANYQFQKVFLKPFEIIMAKNPSTDIREFILQCFSRMMFTKVTNVKSGWISVFTICKIAARDSHESVVVAAFELVERLLCNHFPLISDAMPELVDALVSFGLSPFTDMALQALSHLTRCAQWLGSNVHSTGVVGSVGVSDETVAPDSSPSSDVPILGTSAAVGGESIVQAGGFVVTDSAPELNVWLCILRGLAQLIGDRRFEVRSRSLQVLFKVLKMHGSLFSPTVWQIIYRGVLIPIFEDALRDEADNPKLTGVQITTDFQFVPLTSSIDVARPAAFSGRSSTALPLTSASSSRSHSGSLSGPARKGEPAASVDHDHASWIRTTCHAALSSLVDLFAHFHPVVHFLLSDVLALVGNCILQDSDELAKIGCKCWLMLIQSVGHMFDEAQWSTFLASFQTLMIETLPHEICSDATRQRVVSATPPPPPPPTASVGMSSLPFQLRPVVTKCTIQHMLLDATSDLFRLHFPRLSLVHVDLVLSFLLKSVDFARHFNADVDFRRKLWAAGFREHQRSIPDLYFQESHGLAVYVGILMRMYKSDSHSAFEAPAIAEPRLVPLIANIISSFASKDRVNRGNDAPRSHDDELRCQEPVLVLVLQGVQEWTDEQFSHHLGTLFPLLMDVVEIESVAARKAVRELMQSRLPRMFATT